MDAAHHANTPLARRLQKQAEALEKTPKLGVALDQACQDPKRQAAALRDPRAFLRKAGLSLPDGLAFDLFEHPPRVLPFPEWTPFVIELTRCRTYWVIECDDSPGVGGQRKCELKETQLCLGFRIYPRPWPRGPFTL